MAAVPQQLTLEAAVKAALDHNPGYRAAILEAQAARIAADRDKPVARSVVTLNAEATLQTPTVTFPRGSEEATVLPDRFARLALVASQPLYRAGVRDAWSRFRSMRDAASAELARARNALIRDVRKAYVQALTARAMTAVAREAREVAAQHRALVVRMIEAGLAAPRDLSVAEGDLAEAEEGVVRADNGLRLALSDLQRLIGSREPVDADSLAEPGAGAADSTADDLLRSALRLRPELIALRKGIQAAEAGVALARAQGGPEVALQCSVARQTPSAFVPRDWAALGLAVSWPLRDGGKRHADAEEARVRLDQLRARLDEAEAGIRLETQSAIAGIEAARSRIALCERRLKAAHDALEITEIRYEQRAATILELSGARLAVSRAAAACCEARSDLFLANAELKYATGADVAGWELIAEGGELGGLP
jgi:cobalt-zinc-cadmium efflux system outer membrane protein